MGVPGYVPQIGERDLDKVIRAVRNLFELLGAEPLTEDSSPDTANDWLFLLDVSAGEVKKVHPDTVVPPAATVEIERKNGILTPAENLICKYVSATTVDIDADAVLLFDSSGNAKRFASLNETLDITASGANGLDTGSEGSSRWYHLWAIGKEDGTLDGLLSESSTAPTPPSGYDFKGYLGAVYNNSSSNFDKFAQRGNRFSVPYVQVLNNGTSASFATISLSAFLPPTATHAVLQPGVGTSSGTAYVSLTVSSGGSGTTPDTDQCFFAATAGTDKAFSPGMVQLMTTAQQISYWVTGTNGRATIFLIGGVY